MTKGELLNIIHKIQNRCGLEDPIAVTYYWNEEGKAVFKAFFESLYLPESLRVDDEIIQNTFLVQNVYEYEDDFLLTELNQDKGYVAFIPDDQDFKVVKSHKEAIQKETKQEESLVHLCNGHNLSESFARAKGYVLQESNSVTDAATEGNENATSGETGAVDNVTKPEAKPTKMDVLFASLKNPLAKEGSKAIEKVINTVKGLPKDPKKPIKFIISVTPRDDEKDLWGFWHACIEAYVKKLNDANYEKCLLATEGHNEKLSGILQKAEVEKLTFLTPEEDCRKTIGTYNLPKLLSADVIETAEGASDDTSLDTAIKLAKELTKAYDEQIKKFGGVKPDKSEKDLKGDKEAKPTHWMKKYVKALSEALNTKPNVAIAIALLKDIYTSNADDQARDEFQSLKKKQDALKQDIKNLQSKDSLRVADLQNLGVRKSLMALGSSAGSNLVSSERNNDAENGGGMFTSQKKQYGANASVKPKTPKDPKDVEKRKRISDYDNDFSIFCAYFGRVGDFTLKHIGTSFCGKFQKLVDCFDETLSAYCSVTIGIRQDEFDAAKEAEEGEENVDAVSDEGNTDAENSSEKNTDAASEEEAK